MSRRSVREILRIHGPVRWAGLLFILVMSGFAIAELLAPSVSPAHYFPKGALVYAETGDLKALLTWWKNSKFRTTWQGTINYQQFQNSRLYLKLGERTDAF